MLHALQHLITADSAGAVERAARRACASESGRPDRFKTLVSLHGVMDLLSFVCRPIVAATTCRVEHVPWTRSLILVRIRPVIRQVRAEGTSATCPHAWAWSSHGHFLALALAAGRCHDEDCSQQHRVARARVVLFDQNGELRAAGGGRATETKRRGVICVLWGCGGIIKESL